ncbi:MAG: hypothetical protein WCQ16_11695 [Verrucomicrobiae bacterium]
MKSFLLAHGLCLSSLLLFSGCTNSEGRFRPPDPIGYALFELFDRGPHTPAGRTNTDSDAQFVGTDNSPATRGYPPSRDSIWVDGTWGTSNGRRVWVPAHWQ